MGENYTFERIHGNDYSGLKTRDMLIAKITFGGLSDGKMVSGVVEDIQVEEGSNRQVKVRFTDDRPKFTENPHETYIEGNISNILYKVSEDVLQGNVSIPELHAIVNRFEVEPSEGNRDFVLEHLEDAIIHHKA
jgi:hypothetical protein